MGERILIVDDEPSSIQAIEDLLRGKGYEVMLAETGAAALAIVRDESIGLTILDLGLRGREDGLDLLPEFKMVRPEMSIIILTGRRRTAEDAFAAGQRRADRYVEKTIDPGEFLTIVAEEFQVYQRRYAQLKQLTNCSGLVHAPNGSMSRVVRLAVAVAGQDTTVLLQGETGTGKQILAGLIHKSSPRNTKPFREVNCAGLQPDLVDSTLFGHEKGAFTGAVAQRIGLFEEADGGTLFLDEIAGMEMAVQAKLLKVLDLGRIRRVGGQKDIQVDVRLIAATNQDLAEEVARCRFRKDLFFRLKVFTVNIPPLRQRREDILLLAQHFLRQFYGARPPILSPATEKMLLAHSWPGNVRELSNVIEQLSAAHRELLEVLPLHLEKAISATDHPAEVLAAASQPIPEATPLSDAPSASLTKDEAERQHLKTTLEAHGWNISRAARAWGVARQTLINKMKKYNLTREK